MAILVENNNKTTFLFDAKTFFHMLQFRHLLNFNGYLMISRVVLHALFYIFITTKFTTKFNCETLLTLTWDLTAWMNWTHPRSHQTQLATDVVLTSRWRYVWRGQWCWGKSFLRVGREVKRRGQMCVAAEGREAEGETDIDFVLYFTLLKDFEEQHFDSNSQARNVHAPRHHRDDQ